MSDDFKRSGQCQGCTRRELLRTAGTYIAGVSIFGLSSCASTPTLRGEFRNNEITVARAAVEAASEPLTIVADGLDNPVILVSGGEFPNCTLGSMHPPGLLRRSELRGPTMPLSRLDLCP